MGEEKITLNMQLLQRTYVDCWYCINYELHGFGIKSNFTT